jgi:dCMP deaminase
VTNHPCSICTKILLNAGVKRVVYGEGYPDELARYLVEEARNLGLLEVTCLGG